MKCVHLEQKSPEWKQWRVQGITATDSPVILGLNPRKTIWRLWAEKVQFLRVPDLSNVPAIRFGVENEDVARNIYEQKFNDILLPFCATYDANPIFRASFDGIDGNGMPVEIKCPGSNTLADVYANRENSEAYRLYYAQVQHQMLVAESDRARLIFYDPSRNDIEVFDIDRDESCIQRILTEGEAFFECVAKRKAPKRDPQRDMYIPKAPEDVRRWMAAASELIAADKAMTAKKLEIEQIEKRMDAAKSQIIDILGDEEFCADYGGIATTKSVVRGKVDYKAMCIKLLGREPTEAEMAPYQKAPSTRWVFRTTGVLSQEIIDEATLAEIEENTVEPVESLWF